MDGLWLSLKLLLLLGVANSAPIAAKRLLGSRWNAPLDGGAMFFDGRPLLGPGKTIRGVVAAIAAAAIAAWALAIPPSVGALAGAVSMAGDALASFTKRRLGVAPSGRAVGLDQIPESLLPLLAVQGLLDLSAAQIAGITAAFLVLEIPLARLAYRLGLRDRPY
ncbi:MAG: CDP-archaeol synthase [Burkholderiales bacterium]|nr:MAG: CDP-archaeol synthase [Burkholderiales bacterium]